MPRLYLVRHARATGGFGEAADPALDDLGQKQAEAMATTLAPLGPLPMLTSPLRRARDTAAALERHWNTMAIVDAGVGEVPAPSDDLAEREKWIRQAMGQTWTDLGPRYTSWRTMVTELLLRIKADTVVVSHFVAINAVIGHATGDDRVMCAALGNASVTTVDHDNRSFTLVDIGEQDATVVQ